MIGDYISKIRQYVSKVFADNPNDEDEPLHLLEYAYKRADNALVEDRLE